MSAINTHWKRGQSGNPNGRPKGLKFPSSVTAEKLKRLIFGHARKVIETTVNGKPVTGRRLQLALTRVYNEDPKGYADIVLKAMPKNLDIDLTVETSWSSMFADVNQRMRDLEVSAN